MKEERTRLGLAIALLVLVLLGAAWALPWWSIEESTGRQVAPDGPEQEQTGVERREQDVHVDGSRGDLEPTHPARESSALSWLRIGILSAAAATVLYVLGQLPVLARFLNRPVCMALGAVAFAGVLAALVVTWVRLPLAWEGLGATNPFTAVLLENGYVRSHLHLGWVAGAFAAFGALGMVLSAYSAGDASPETIEEFRVSA